MDLVIVVMLIGHVLGDFYFQTAKMVENRKTSFKAVLWHGFVYALCMLIIFFTGVSITLNSVGLCISLSIAHLFIDILKYLYLHSKAGDTWLKKNIFYVDQTVHLVTLAVCWKCLGQGLCVRGFISQEVTYLPGLPVSILLGILCILRPVNIFIINTELWNSKAASEGGTASQVSSDEARSSGRVIGYLERLIIFMFLLYNQFSAMAFVLTAKSVARFKEIEQDKSRAEYYLIGTLLSTVSVMLITILLGLCGNGT